MNYIKSHKLLISIRDEITLYEDKEYSAEEILNSIMLMIDSSNLIF
jgi:hypothetical protein